MLKRATILFGAVAAVLLTALPVHADSGDSNPAACSTYEICFTRDADNVRYQRQFFYDDSDHGGNHYYDGTTGAWTSIKLQDSADRAKNCDGSHYVRVSDWNGIWPTQNWDIANDCTWKTIGSSVKNQNDAHDRI